jgi:hypothetical protein
MNSTLSLNITLENKRHMNYGITSIGLKEESLNNNYHELKNKNKKNEKSNDNNSVLPTNNAEITNTGFLSNDINLDSLKRHTLPKKKNSLLFSSSKKTKPIVSIENKDSINKNLNFLKSLFSSDRNK